MRTKRFVVCAVVALLALGGVWAYAKGKAQGDCCTAGATCCPDGPCCPSAKASAVPATCSPEDCCPECVACCAIDGDCWECYLCCLAMGCDPSFCFPAAAAVKAEAVKKGQESAPVAVRQNCSDTCCKDGCK